VKTSRAALSPREVAQATGVSTDTLRHYERRGLIAPPLRTAAGYRRYAPEVVERVQLIQRALVVGFSLADLARVLRERDRGGAPCRSVRAMVGDRLEHLDRQLEELTTLRRELRGLLAQWDERLAVTPAGTQARLLDSFGGRSIIDRITKETFARGRRKRRA
jgi:DNA-binding transcriptional MerR regulator